MLIENELQKLKEETLREIKNAASQSNDEKIIEASDRLKEILKLEEKSNEIRLALQNIQKGAVPPVFPKAQNQTVVVKVSPKGLGRSARIKFLELLRKQGFNCQNTKGQLYNINNKIVGVAFATEGKPNRPNKWFLGLPSEQNYHTIVLLCETDTDKLTAFILSSDTLKKYPSLCDRGIGGQLKFNINRINDVYQLRIPGDGSIEINTFIDAFENLR